MPIYEYQCQACGNKMETIQKHSEPPLTECPVCHKNELKKLISAVAFRLKGNGWYETDFKSGSKKNLAGRDEKSGSGNESAGKSPGKSEGKKGSDSTKKDSGKSNKSDSESGSSKSSGGSSSSSGGSD